ncbi:hypothetical protein [Gardnerella sp. Marseille-Q2328]|uniref:hypothetical protein n=1 Tax=Gardnerella sp. Marseille-Q2328 TaxID=2759694 RepID=UPI002023D07E|nr:hypothetical protein [Gardnerella sp. Marseille-Q2328]
MVKLTRVTRSLTKLALEVPRTSNLSEFPLRIAFARAMLRESRSSAHANHNLAPKYHHTTLPCLRQSRRRQTSLALKAPRAFNLSKLGAPNCFRARNAARKQVVALTQNAICNINKVFNAEVKNLPKHKSF